jgi:hypothetical protein
MCAAVLSTYLQALPPCTEPGHATMQIQPCRRTPVAHAPHLAALAILSVTCDELQPTSTARPCTLVASAPP